MTTVEISTDTAQLLQTEANRRGITIEALLAELAAGIGSDPMESFIGCGSSGISEPFDIHAERQTLADAKTAAGLENL